MTATTSTQPQVRAMVVDDSAVIRGFLTKFLESDPEIKVTSSVSNGELAIASLKRSPVDVIILDIEMPVMNGLEALPKLLQTDPDVQIIMASTLTTEGATVTMQALKMGAAECLAKPTTSQELAGTKEFRLSLVSKAKALGHVTQKRRERKGIPMAASTGLATKQLGVASVAPKPQIKLRSEIFIGSFDAIAIGSSTGGPQALLNVFDGLKGGLKQPIFITQHMPPTFTAILADHLSKQSGLVCAEGKEGEEVKGGRIYLAPGNFHMTVKLSADGKRVIALNQDAPENFCRPAVDPMLRSLVSVYGKKILAVILTGMGSDGAKGCQMVADAGGVVIAQDEPSSVVWGMPGAAAAAGVCTRILPLAQIAGSIKEFAVRI